MKGKLIVFLVIATGITVAAVGSAAERANALQQKAQLVERTAKEWLKKGEDPRQAFMLMGKAKQFFDSGDINRGEHCVDEAMSVLELRTPDSAEKGPLSDLYRNPQQIEIAGYTMDSMEPCISMDGKYLFFNNTNEEPDTHLYAARRISETKFEFIGPVQGARFTPIGTKPSFDEREACPATDFANELFFISPHSYGKDMHTLWFGKWHADPNGKSMVLTDKKQVEGHILPEVRPWIDLDPALTPNGKTMVFSRAKVVPEQPFPANAYLMIANRQADGSFNTLPNSADLLKNVTDEKMLQYAPAITNDTLELYWTQCETGLPIFRTMVATRKSPTEPFSKPSRLTAITAFSEAPSLTADKSELFFHKKVKGRFHVFRMTRRK